MRGIVLSISIAFMLCVVGTLIMPVDAKCIESSLDTGVPFKGVGLVRYVNGEWHAIIVINVPVLLTVEPIFMLVPGSKVSIDENATIIHIFGRIYFVSGYMYGYPMPPLLKQYSS